MSAYRPKRVAEMLHKEIAARFRTELKDPRLEPISITAVDITRDLRRATVSWMPLGGGVASEDLIAAVTDAARRLRGPVGRALRLRNAPELLFVLDDHTDRAARLTTILDQLARERGGEE